MTRNALRIPLVLTWTATAAAVACAGISACSSSSSSGGPTATLDASLQEDVAPEAAVSEAAPSDAPIAIKDGMVGIDTAAPAECEGVTEAGIIFFQADAAECPDGDPTIVV